MARRIELYAASRAFHPDPWNRRIPTYQRFLLLNALYDMSLSFEHSPLIGCSSVVFPPSMTCSGHVLLGRNFDFEVHDVFDREKAAIVFAEHDKVPVLSVAWPGLVGVATGMNSAGVGVVVHGARAGEPTPDGQRVLITMREASANALTTDQAVQWITQCPPVVLHLAFVADASGDAAIIERVPSRHAFVRRFAQDSSVTLTNHFEGPARTDPANMRIRQQTSTVPRAERWSELAAHRRDVPVEDVIWIFRDKMAA